MSLQKKSDNVSYEMSHDVNKNQIKTAAEASKWWQTNGDNKKHVPALRISLRMFTRKKYSDR